MSKAISDDDEPIVPAQLSATIKQALALTQSIATTGHEKIDAELLAAEQALRRARAAVLDLADGSTLSPEALPRSPGAETIVVCPVCKTEWKFDDHDNCPTCNLAPQGVN